MCSAVPLTACSTPYQPAGCRLGLFGGSRRIAIRSSPKRTTERADQMLEPRAKATGLSSSQMGPSSYLVGACMAEEDPTEITGRSPLSRPRVGPVTRSSRRWRRTGGGAAAPCEENRQSRDVAATRDHNGTTCCSAWLKLIG